MHRYAIIDTADNRLLTVVEYASAPGDPPPGFGEGVIAIQSGEVGGDWTYDGSNLIAPPTETLREFFPIISDRQFFQALALTGEITKDEALAAVQQGQIPEVLNKFIDAISDLNEQFAARMILSGATQFERNHPLVAQFGYALGWTDEQLNELWRTAAQL